ncbi:Hypp752 [Branchiostoma lanceolatum]|uniref:Hypp752 protein n=2 Tax=Branchiostoma lanceolatum TaxID=7740 RepID=A0A8J9VCZ8_BRALA|nr:Hypp752 [Branchiostoma lanceolatum]
MTQPAQPALFQDWVQTSGAASSKAKNTLYFLFPTFAAPGTEPGNPLQIRNMEAEDIEFVSRMLVDAFSDKFEHAVGKNRMEGAVQQTVASLGRSQDVWHRYRVAVYEGRPAGAMAIKFHGDSAMGDFSCGEACSFLGCGTCGLICMGAALENDNIPVGQCYLDHIGVDASFRGKGIGKVMLDRADHEAREHGCTAIFLWVKKGNRAVHLYERQGYVITHTFGGWFKRCATGSRDWHNMEKQL